MAIVQNPLIGRASGKYGNSVFSTQFGKNVIKTKALTVADAKSDAQIERRNGVTQMVAIFRAIVAAAKSGFKSLAVGMSAYNAFSSYNLKNAFTFSGAGEATFDPTKLLISKGTIETTLATSVTGTAASANVAFAFPIGNNAAGQSASDIAIIAVFNATQKKWGGTLTSAARSTGVAELVMASPCESGDVLHGYLGFTDAAGAQQSDSDYVTSIVA